MSYTFVSKGNQEKGVRHCPTQLIQADCYVRLLTVSKRFVVNLKVEGLSIAGSIKIKAAISMVASLENAGLMHSYPTLIESSSGNLGVALSMVCAAKGYRFICVSDPNISSFNAKLIKAYGAQLIVVDQRDQNGGYLATRISLIKEKLSRDPNLVWVNQYENVANVEAHYQSTGKEVLDYFPGLDYIFIGVGTTGTLGGVSRRVREFSPDTKIIAVDSVGSVTFGGAPGKRYIPGLGTSTPPPIRTYSSFDEMLMIPETDTIKMCHEFARQGLLLGGSTGTVLAGVRQYAKNIPEQACVVAISPDLGERYLDTIYDESWCKQNFGLSLFDNTTIR